MNDSTTGFAQILAGLTPQNDGFVAEIPDYWCQGRTAYGGITAGLAVAVARLTFSRLPPLRTMLVNFTGPVNGIPLFTPHCLRQGKSVTTIQVTVESGQQTAAQVIFCFGGNRKSTLRVPGQLSPLQKSPLEYEPFLSDQAAIFAPKFADQFETRLVAGSRPVSGASTGYIRAVSRHQDVESRIGIESLVAIADVLPPAALAMAQSPAPISSLTWMLNLLSDDPVTREGWWQLDTAMTSSADGYSSQLMHVWSLDGTQVAEGMQSVTQFF